MVTTRPLAARMRGSMVFTPASTPSTFTSSARLWVSTATHSTSPKVAQPALFTIPHRPELRGNGLNKCKMQSCVTWRGS